VTTESDVEPTAGAIDFLPLAFDLGAGTEGGGIDVLVLVLLVATIRYLGLPESYKILVEFQLDF